MAMKKQNMKTEEDTTVFFHRRHLTAHKREIKDFPKSRRVGTQYEFKNQNDNAAM
jgi:hypothetical protein